MSYLIDTFLKRGAVLASELASPVPDRHYPAELQHFTFDHELNGVIDAQGEEMDDRWQLVVTGNVVSTVRANLGGESGRGLPEDRQVRDAAGFLRAAIRYRLQDLADLLWRPVDALLVSREFSGLFVLIPTLWLSVVFIRAGGLYGLADHLEDLGVAAGFAYWLVRVGRWWRDVKPPERKPRRTRHKSE